MTERGTLSSAQIDRVLSIVEQLIGLIDCPAPGEPVIHGLEPHQARVERDPEDIKTAIRKRWGSVAAFERQYSLPALSVRDILRGKKRARIARVVAKALDIPLQDLDALQGWYQGSDCAAEPDESLRQNAGETWREVAFSALSRCVHLAGSGSKFARDLKISQARQWRIVNQYKLLPAELVPVAESLYNVSRHLLRPDIYGPEGGR